MKVAVRMRPFNSREVERGSTLCIKMPHGTQQTIIVDPTTGTCGWTAAWVVRLSVTVGFNCALHSPGTAPRHLFPSSHAGKERMFQFDFSYNSFVPRDDEEYASQATVWKDIGVGVLNNAYEGGRQSFCRRRLCR